MKNYFVLNQDLTKIQAIDALATILQDESLQLTGEMEKVGLSAWKRCFLVRDYENGNTYGYNDSDGYHFENLERSWIISKISIKAASWTIWIQNVTMVP